MRGIIVGSLLVCLGIVGGCMAIRESYGYKPPWGIMRQSGLPNVQIQQAQEFAIRLDTSQISRNYPFLGPAHDPVDTITGLQGFTAAFQAAFTGQVFCRASGDGGADTWVIQTDNNARIDLEEYSRDMIAHCAIPVAGPGGTLREEGIQRGLTFVDAGNAVSKGILIDVIVNRIQFNTLEMVTADSNNAAISSMNTALMPDEFFARIIFTDRSTNTVLYDGELETSNYSIDPRIKVAQNMAWRGVKIRILDGASNLAWMVTNIMKNGTFVSAREAQGIRL